MEEDLKTAWNAAWARGRAHLKTARERVLFYKRWSVLRAAWVAAAVVVVEPTV